MENKFTVTYEWSAGSIPPPYYHKYEIRIDDKAGGRISLYFEDSTKDAPAWQSIFKVSDDDLNKIGYLLTINEQSNNHNISEEDLLMIGISQEIIAHTISSNETINLSPRFHLFKEVKDIIYSLVPDNAWASIKHIQSVHAEGRTDPNQ